jgi:hypothetical protein
MGPSTSADANTEETVTFYRFVPNGKLGPQSFVDGVPQPIYTSTDPNVAQLEQQFYEESLPFYEGPWYPHTYVSIVSVKELRALEPTWGTDPGSVYATDAASTLLAAPASLGAITLRTFKGFQSASDLVPSLDEAAIREALSAGKIAWPPGDFLHHLMRLFEDQPDRLQDPGNVLVGEIVDEKFGGEWIPASDFGPRFDELIQMINTGWVRLENKGVGVDDGKNYVVVRYQTGGFGGSEDTSVWPRVGVLLVGV